MSVVRTLSSECPQPFSIASMLNRANGVLLRSGDPQDLFVTLFCGIYKPDRRHLAFANAGHPPPVLLRSGRKAVFLSEGASLPLAVVAEFAAAESEVSLESGDILVLYTDGITDARGGGTELFGLDRLRECLERCRDLGPERLVRGIRDAVRSFTGPVEASDDSTIVVLGPAQ